jgi:hypothetical protein
LKSSLGYDPKDCRPTWSGDQSSLNADRQLYAANSGTGRPIS